MPALQNIYVVLEKLDEAQVERLCQTLSSLMSYVNLTSNLYLVTGRLSEGMPIVERIQKTVTAFLKENLFARVYVHFVHRISPATMSEVDFHYQYYYQGWKRNTREFDLEGYMHQEVPRLMLLPVIVPDIEVEPDALRGLLDVLRGAFLLPSLYLDEGTFFLSEDEGLFARTEKVYYGQGNSRELGDIVCDLNYQAILDDSCARLGSGSMLMTDPCPASLIIMAEGGTVHGCVNELNKNVNLADIFEEINVDNVMGRYNEHRKSIRDCLWCRGRVVESFADSPLPKETGHEVGALLYHFGTLHQDAENHVQAVEDYKQSLRLSPTEEAESIFFRLGLSHTKTGHYDEAIEAFSRAERAYHDAYYLHFYTGLCHFEKGDHGMAVKKFSDALHLKPQGEDLIKILVYLSTSYNSLGGYEEACLYLERAKETAPFVQEIYSALGFSYFQLKDHDRAIENLSRAVEIDPHSAVDYASLGANYREKGDVHQAIAMYQKALSLDPTLEAAKENLKKLQR